MFVKPVQFLNALPAISDKQLPSSKVTLLKLVQPEKASMSILYTFCGMVMLVKLLQFSKASLPMLVILFGRLISVSAVQFAKTPSAMPSKVLLSAKVTLVKPVQLRCLC